MIKCWHYRRIISRCADEDTPLPSAAHAHIARCPDCHRLHETEHQIASQLSASAAAQKLRQPPNFIHTGIMARIAASSPVPQPIAGLSLLRWPVAVAGIIVVLTTVLLWPRQPHAKPSPIAESEVMLELPNTKDLTQWATIPDQPLQTEAKAVVHDARGAMTALADNFFPEKLRQSLLNPPSAQN